MRKSTNKKSVSRPKVLAVSSGKGGVGKSVSSLSISSLLAEKENVLLLDLDPQYAATKHLAYSHPDYDREKTIRQVLLGEIPIEDSILQITGNLSFIPSQLRLQNIEKELDEMNPLFLLNDLIQPLKEEYDYIIFDNSPSTGLLTKSALLCSSHVLIPTQMEAWPIEAIEITMELIDKVRQSQRYIEQNIENVMILPTFWEDGRQLTKAFSGALKDSYGDYLARTVIHRSVEIGKTFSSPGMMLQSSMRAYKEYSSVIKEFMGEVV